MKRFTNADSSLAELRSSDEKLRDIMDRSKTLIDVKLALAAKYERLSKLSGSKPRQATLAHQALKYQRQAEQLKRVQNQK